jgi:hypothetical protein
MDIVERLTTIRRELPVLERHTYLNTGTAGPGRCHRLRDKLLAHLSA